MSFLAAAAVALRLMNPNDVPIEASLQCGGESRPIVLDAREVRDVEGCESAVSALMPLLVLETSVENGVERQKTIDPDNSCPVSPIYVPLFACRNGNVIAYTNAIEGARYEWAAEGATIVGDNRSQRVVLQINDTTVKLTCKITTIECGPVTVNGAIAVREPIVVRELRVPATTTANQPMTITWAYQAGREPQSQALTGDLFPKPVVLDAAQRSYTFTPQTGGSRTVELRASYAKQIPLAPQSKKRRRSVSGSVTATECPAALATAKVDVQGCVQAFPILDAPADVAAGSTFVVKVDNEDGQKVEWSAENGTVLSVSPFYDNATIVAGASGQTKVTARVERKPGCFVSATADVSILLPANQCAMPPVATVAYQSHDCNSAVVRATFTGTGPFAGEWSDGTPFRTTSNTLVHGFNAPGAYAITDFRDSSCFGNVTGSATVAQFKPAVALEATQACGIAKLTATLTGVPPFTVRWSDGQTFTTNETTVTRSVQGGTSPYFLDRWSLTVTDAACNTPVRSRDIEVQPVPVLRYGGYPYCQTNSSSGVWVQGYFENAPKGPYRLEWTDGVTASSPFNAYAERLVKVTAPSAKYDLARAFVGECELDVTGMSATVLNRPVATIQTPSTTQGCATEPLSASLAIVPPPGTAITWALTNNARILSGQGTSSITFTADSAAKYDLTVRTDYPDGYCSQTSSKITYTFVQRQTVKNIKLEPSTIPPGGKATLTWEPTDGTVASVTTTSARSGDLHKDQKCCTAYFVDTGGVPASVPIYVSWYDPCAGYQTQTLTLTISP